MSDSYKLKEVRIQVQPGVELIAELSSVAGLSELLAHLKGHDFSPVPPSEGKTERDAASDGNRDAAPDESPAARVERNAGLQTGDLRSHSVLAFKDKIPQLLRPSSFGNVTDAALILVHAVETGLGTPSVSYESFKALFEGQNVKSGTPLSMMLTNLRNGGYLDKSAYKDGRKLRLTAKGDQKAIQVLKDLVKNGKA